MGTIGTTNVASGGTLAPGAPFGTLTVTGNIGFAPGSTYTVGIDPADTATLLHATGTATIGGGNVQAIIDGTVFRTGARYTILTADAGVSGQFSAFTNTRPLLDMTLVYALNNVYLDVARNSRTLCSRNVTRNQCAVSTTDVALGAGNPAVEAVRNLPDVPSIQHALDLLSGEIYASSKVCCWKTAVSFGTQPLIGPWQMSGSAAAPASPAAGFAVQENPATSRAVWGRTFGSFGLRNGDGNAAHRHVHCGHVCGCRYTGYRSVPSWHGYWIQQFFLQRKRARVVRFK